MFKKTCPTCGKEFQAEERKDIYCSEPCWWNKRKQLILGSGNGRWKGGIKVHGGYRYIKNRDHPHADKNGYVPEHRLIMEKYLGRFLERKECIHHINENTLDNKIENLMLFPTNGQHANYHRKLKQQQKHCSINHNETH